jgi:DDE superfamily endonuclease
MRQSTKTHSATRGFHAFLPCRAAVVVPDPHLPGRDHPPPPEGDRLVLAEAEPWAAGSPRAGLPAERRDVRRDRRRVRGRDHDGLAVRGRSRLPDAKKAGHAYVVVDGTLIPIDRVAADRPFYSGKHKKHGMNLQVIASPAGDILWVSGPLPSSVHDKKAEWIWGVLHELESAGLIAWRTRATREARTRKSPARRRTNPSPRR